MLLVRHHEKVKIGSRNSHLRTQYSLNSCICNIPKTLNSLTTQLFEHYKKHRKFWTIELTK
jgi:hypothetical protein